jgi:hypothetical protein
VLGSPEGVFKEVELIPRSRGILDGVDLIQQFTNALCLESIKGMELNLNETGRFQYLRQPGKGLVIARNLILGS